MVIAPASTGNARSNRKAVTSTDQTNSGILCSVMPGARMLKIVVMKLIAPRIDDAPARCSAKIAKSIAGPGWPAVEDSGGYAVQPPPKPEPLAGPSTKSDVTSRMNAAARNQNEMLFMRGNAISGAPIINGTNQFPNPPISAGMIMKNTMISPCAVTNELNVCGLVKNCIPGSCSSSRMPIERMPPTMPPKIANTRYIVPMSLWFVE
jgi:hypothetical protein